MYHRAHKKKYRLVITGNPGVGKHTTAKFLVQSLIGAKIVDINKIAIDNNVMITKKARDNAEIDKKRLAKLMKFELKNLQHLVIVGHLAPYVMKSLAIDLVVVLRRSSNELSRIFEERKYSDRKIKENIASEILDICLYDAVMTFGKDKITEFDTTGKRPQEITNKILLSLYKPSTRRLGTVDWLTPIYQKGDINKFMEY